MPTSIVQIVWFRTLSSDGCERIPFDGRDRRRLERVCRYILRPPFALSSIEARHGGVVRIHFSHPRASGATFTDVSVDTFLARLAALVPPPHFNVTRYYGIFANRHAHRKAALAPERPASAPRQLGLFETPRNLRVVQVEGMHETPEPSPRRLAWAIVPCQA